MSRNKRYFMLKEMDLEVTQGQVEDFIYLWEQGYALRNIARKLRLDYENTCVLAFDLSMQEKIEPRPNGIADNTMVMGE